LKRMRDAAHEVWPVWSAGSNCNRLERPRRLNNDGFGASLCLRIPSHNFFIMRPHSSVRILNGGPVVILLLREALREGEGEIGE
jgi:hypothetical protein